MSDKPYFPNARQHKTRPSKSFFDRLKTHDYDHQSLEKELRHELSRAAQTQEMEQKILKIINHLGRTDYSFIRLDPAVNQSSQRAMIPRALLCSYQREKYYQSAILTQAKIASIRNRHLSMLYHFVASAPCDTPMLSKRRIQYVLITSAGRYNYDITPSNTPVTEQYTCSTSNNTIEQHSKEHDRAIDVFHPLVSAITYVGCRKFPELFLHGAGKNRPIINPQPQRLLNILVLEDATLNQAAQQLCLTINTVNKHMATAKSALGTNTIAGTVWRAINEGLIGE